MTSPIDVLDISGFEDALCAKCGMPWAESHAIRCPKCGIPRVADTKLLSSPLGGRPWASVESEAEPKLPPEPNEGHGVPSPRVTLSVTAGSQRGRQIGLTAHQTLLLGRCPKNDIAVDDEFASWHHLMLEVHPPLVCLRDLESLNGTYVNRVRVGGRFASDHEDGRNHGVLLRDGDVVASGMNGFVVHIESAGRGLALPAKLPERVEIPGYTLVQSLPQDGVGRVFRATRDRDGSPVVMKIVNPEARIAGSRSDDLLHHVRTLHALQYPHLTRIEDFGIHDGWCWIATKFKTGDAGKLAHRRGGRLPWPLLVPVLLQALKGLAYAHNMGFVHHHLQPSSILIRKERSARFVQLRDIGLTPIVEHFGLQPLVYTGDTMRNLDFTPRERITRFRKVLPASDVWSMAACA